MRHVPLPAPVLRAITPVLRLYWRVARPRTFGVKVLVVHPDDPAQFLIVRHAYGDRQLWGLPGGGYKPAKETPTQAAAREVREELGISVNGLVTLDVIQTQLEAKRDTLTIMQAIGTTSKVELAHEIAAAKWITHTELPENEPVSRWLRAALSARD